MTISSRWTLVITHSSVGMATNECRLRGIEVVRIVKETSAGTTTLEICSEDSDAPAAVYAWLNERPAPRTMNLLSIAAKAVR